MPSLKEPWFEFAYSLEAIVAFTLIWVLTRRSKPPFTLAAALVIAAAFFSGVLCLTFAVQLERHGDMTGVLVAVVGMASLGLSSRKANTPQIRAARKARMRDFKDKFNLKTHIPD